MDLLACNTLSIISWPLRSFKKKIYKVSVFSTFPLHLPFTVCQIKQTTPAIIYVSFHISRGKMLVCLWQHHWHPQPRMRVGVPPRESHPTACRPPQRSLLGAGGRVQLTGGNREPSELGNPPASEQHWDLCWTGEQPGPSHSPSRVQLSRRRTRCHKFLFSSLLPSGFQWNQCQCFSETEMSQGKHKPHLGTLRAMWRIQCAKSINAQVGPGSHSSLGQEAIALSGRSMVSPFKEIDPAPTSEWTLRESVSEIHRKRWHSRISLTEDQRKHPVEYINHI